MRVIGREVTLQELLAVDRYWYLATPFNKYPGGHWIAFVHACQAAAFLMKHGVKLMCPISHTYSVQEFGDLKGRGYDFWMPIDEPLVRMANGLIVTTMPTWATSTGIDMERRWTAEDHKPEVFLPWPLPEDLK